MLFIFILGFNLKSALAWPPKCLSTQRFSNWLQGRAVESLCMSWWLCDGNQRWSGAQKEERRRRGKHRELLFNSKLRVLTRCQWAKIEETPTLHCLGVNVTYWSLQKSTDREKREDSLLCWRRLGAIFPARTDGEKPCAALMQEGHNFTCHGASINMLKYLNRFTLITPFLTSGCDDASGQTTSGLVLKQPQM